MGVMSCSRRGCCKIMCDTYIESIGYICYKCQNDFEKYVAKKNVKRTEETLHKLLSKFISKEKRYSFSEDLGGMTTSEFFNLFKPNYDDN